MERVELDRGSSRREDGEDQAPRSCEQGWTDRAQGPESRSDCGSGRPWLQALGQTQEALSGDRVRKTPGKRCVWRQPRAGGRLGGH